MHFLVDFGGPAKNHQPQLRLLVGQQGPSFLDVGFWYIDEDGALVHVPPNDEHQPW